MIAITISSDFAPGWMQEEALTMIKHFGIKVTWFSTDVVPSCDLIEPGIYANFMPGSTQGEESERWRYTRQSNVLGACLSKNPLAKAVRTRSMYDSEWLMEELLLRTRMTHDSCLLLPGCSWARPFRHERHKESIVRVPVTWQDYYSLFLPLAIPEKADYAVFDFHVKHLVMNSPSIDWYEYNKSQIKFPSTSPRFDSQGTGSSFEKACEIYGKESRWITEFEA
jgi:hypothetical protein